MQWPPFKKKEKPPTLADEILAKPKEPLPPYRVVAWQEEINPETWEGYVEKNWPGHNWYTKTGFKCSKPTKEEVVATCQAEIDRLIRKDETHGVVA